MIAYAAKKELLTINWKTLDLALQLQMVFHISVVKKKILIPMVMLVLRKGGTSLQMQAYELSPISKETFIEAVKSQMQIARMPSNPNP